MFLKIEQEIEKGNLVKARKALRQIAKLKELPQADLLKYFRLSRRVGDFQYGSTQLEKIGIIFPELEIELAFFLGELGAVKQAIRLLSENTKPLSIDFEIQRNLQLGNFNSLLHNYETAEAAYIKMTALAENHNPMLHLVGQLNTLGHRIYRGYELKEQIKQLKNLQDQKLKKAPLLNQGAYYFLTLAYQKLNQTKTAQKFLSQAFDLAVEHRLRESLLLRLTALELNPLDATPTDFSVLKKQILDQVHVLYYDQFHKILGLRSQLENNLPMAERYFNRVAFGKRNHSHYQDSLLKLVEIEKSLSNETTESNIHGWQLQRQLAQPLTKTQVIYNKLERRDWPLLQNTKKIFSLNEESKLLQNLTLSLVRNLGFPLRDGEIWEDVWQSRFSFISSPTVVRSTLLRWRNSSYSDFAKINMKDRRICLALQPQTKFFLKP
ncbi:MAG: hypothetical protein WA160_10165 [Pseudobdellovibrio sp.]